MGKAKNKQQAVLMEDGEGNTMKVMELIIQKMVD
jgi:hypothetical protein